MEGEQSQSRAQLWIGLVISAACLVALFLFVDPAQIIDSLRSARLEYLLLSELGIILFMLLRAVRWRFMLANSVPYNKVFHIQNIGYMLTYLLPFRLGDVARAVLIGNVPPVTLPQGLSTMVVERILDLLFILTLLPFTLSAVPVLPEGIAYGIRLAAILGPLALIVLVIAANRRQQAQRLSRAVFQRIPFLDTEAWVRRVDELLAGLTSLTSLRDALLLALLSVVVWLPILGAYYTGLIAVNLEPTWAMAGFVVCAAALSIGVPSSPGQLGVFQAAVTFALAEVLGQPAGPSASFAWAYWGLNLITMIVLGIIGILRLGTTFQAVVETTRDMMRRRKSTKPV